MLLLTLALAGSIGPLHASPRQQNVIDREQGPSLEYPFGTDEVGRDVLSRVVNGARISIASALAAVAVGLIGSALLGLIAGYLEGRIGLAIITAMDLMLALPAILLAITIAASRPGSGLGDDRGRTRRTTRLCPPRPRLALAVKRREFVEAAESLGASRWRIMRRHVLPNILTPLIIQATIGVGNAILLVSALGGPRSRGATADAEWAGC